MSLFLPRLSLVLLVLAASACGAPSAPPPLERYTYRQIHMGMEARLVFYAPNDSTARRAARAGFERLAALDDALSNYRPTSALMQLSARAGQGPQPVPPDVLAVLQAANALTRATDGAFDVTVGPYARLWRQARQSGRLPPTDSLDAAARRTGWHRVRLDPIAGTVELLTPGMELDVGGIAKGYAIDEVAHVLRAHGVERSLIELGGDLRLGRPPPGRDGWRVALAHASAPAPDTLTLHDVAVASSGDAEQFIEIDGTRYSHVIDPRTGQGVRHRLAATVVAPTGLAADGYATAVTLLDAEARAAFIATHPQAAFYVLRATPSSKPEPN